MSHKNAHTLRVLHNTKAIFDHTNQIDKTHSSMYKFYEYVISKKPAIRSEVEG